MKKFLLCVYVAIFILPVNGIVSAATNDKIVQVTANEETRLEVFSIIVMLFFIFYFVIYNPSTKNKLSNLGEE